MRSSIRLAAALLVVALLPATASADWKRLRTPNFLFIGDASDGQIRRTAQKLERFHELMVSALPGARANSPVPTVVFVFQDDRSFTPFKPLYEGRPIAVSGYFLGHADQNYITVNNQSGEAGFGTVFHEYTHLLTSSVIATLPVWLSEGLAEFYQSFADLDDGQAAVIGRPLLDHLSELRASTLMPLAELMAIDQQSPIYNEGRRRGLLYAQSWVLVHYLMLGNRSRADQLGTYLAQLQAGVPDAQAFQLAFGSGPDGLDDELGSYVLQVGMPSVRYTFTTPLQGVVPDRTETIDDLEADAYLGDLLARVDRVDEARSRLEGVLAERPGTARATVALGLIDYRAGRRDAALPLLERAAAEDENDAFVQAAFGGALAERLETLSRGTDEYAATLERARTVLGRAVTLDPGVAATVARAGYVELVAGADPDGATALLRQAAALAPAREDYRLLLAQALLRQRQYDESTSMLGPLLARGSSADVRESARRIMGQVADARVAEAARAAATTSASAATPAPTPASSMAPRPDTPPGDPAASPPPTRRNLLLRRPETGETRVMGWLQGVSCEGRTALLIVNTADDTLRLRWDRSGDTVDFVTFDDREPFAIDCGELPRARRVLATYRAAEAAAPAPGVDGAAVAIEIVPEDFTIDP